MDNQPQTQPPQQTQEQKQTPYETQKLREQERRKLEENKPKKKRHCCLIFFIVLIVIIVGGVVAVGATGLYKIPVISSVFNINKPKDLDIKTSPEALASIKQKIPMTISGDKVNYSESGDKIFSGQITVDIKTTSEEVTSWLERFNGSDSPFTNVQARKIEGGVEISAMLSKYVKAPIYLKVMINRVTDKSISLDIQKAKVGLFNVPEKYVKQANDWFEKKINERMADIPGFSMEKLEYHDGYTIFKGTFPANAHPTPGGWIDLLK